MLLVEFFDSSEGDSYANTTSASSIAEAKRKITAKNDPCWKGHHMVGTKSKDGKQVPNCVPGKKGAMNETSHVSDIIQAKELINQAMNNPKLKQQYFDFLKHLRTKYGESYSTEIHQQAAKLAKV